LRSAGQGGELRSDRRVKRGVYLGVEL